MVVRVRNEKRVSEVRKKWKNNVWNLESGKTMENSLVPKMCACAIGAYPIKIPPQKAPGQNHLGEKRVL